MGNSNKDLGRRILRILLPGATVFIGLSYRLYLARFHSEIGIPGLASWWFYVTDNAARLAKGRGLDGTLYAPGQSWVAYLLIQAFNPDPAVLRICFGLLDGLAILFLYLLVKELTGRAAGLAAALLYALWPEGATASINILHDHSPQPIFLFGGLWLLSLWIRRRGWKLLMGAGVLLGLLPMFRTDSMVVAPLAAAALAVVLWWYGSRLKRAAASAGVLVLAALLPSLPYDLSLYADRGTFTHIAAGSAASAVFIRYGRSSGQAGTRQADSEIAFVSGVGQPFGKGWWDDRRLDNLSRFGRKLLLADPARYVKIVLNDSWIHLSTPSGYLLWWPVELAGYEDLGQLFSLRSPEWPLALATALSRIQIPLSSRPLLLALTLLGVITAPFCLGARIWPISATFLGWTAALLVTLPVSRYLIMPYCLAFVLAPIPFAWLARRLWGKDRPTMAGGQLPADGSPRRLSLKAKRPAVLLAAALAAAVLAATFGYPSSPSFWSQSISFGCSLVPGRDAAVYTTMSYQKGDYTLVLQDLQTGQVQRISSPDERTVLHGVSNGDEFLYFGLRRNQFHMVTGSIESGERVAQPLQVAQGRRFHFPLPRPSLSGRLATYVFEERIRVWDLAGDREEVFPLTVPIGEQIWEAAADKDGNRMAVVRQSQSGFSLRIHHQHGNGGMELVREGKGALMRPQWLPDGSGLTFIEQSGQSWKVQQWTLRESRLETLYSGPRFIETAERHPDGRRLLLTLGDSGSFEGYFTGLHVYLLDLQNGELKRLGP